MVTSPGRGCAPPRPPPRAPRGLDDRPPPIRLVPLNHERKEVSPQDWQEGKKDRDRGGKREGGCL